MEADWKYWESTLRLRVLSALALFGDDNLRVPEYIIATTSKDLLDAFISSEDIQGKVWITTIQRSNMRYSNPTTHLLH